MPKRIQLKRTKGWRRPAGAVVVARPTKWGNPFKVGSKLGEVSAILVRAALAAVATAAGTDGGEDRGGGV